MQWDERYDLHLRTTICGTLKTERYLSDDPAVQKLLDEEQLVAWLLSMGPWDVIAHLTWRDRVGRNRDGSVKLMGISEHGAARGVERFMGDLAGVSYFYSVEKNPSRDGHHAHMLWGDCHSVYRKEQWAKWLKLHGRARIEPVKSDKDVAGYASKYVMKLPCWWNIKLQWHRKLKFQDDAQSRLSQPCRLPISMSDTITPTSSETALPTSLLQWIHVGAGVWEPVKQACHSS